MQITENVENATYPILFRHCPCALSSCLNESKKFRYESP